MLYLDKLSKITERSKAWLMGKAVEQYIENESWQILFYRKGIAKSEKRPSKIRKS
ncbi:MAG: ribbon-helix-helix domain-containing protein [Proteobacteria bacterium]|nr:ribbon-helix-helix domain-containing protein [Pseudomonadota bacterium]